MSCNPSCKERNDNGREPISAKRMRARGVRNRQWTCSSWLHHPPLRGFFSMRPFASLLASWSVLAGLAFIAATPAIAQDFYKGKRLSMIVGLAPGGGLDLQARMFSRHLARHIEGSPAITVQNMPGAAGATSMNFMAQRAPKDGSTIIYDSWTPLEQVIKSPHVSYDYAKMTFIGALRGGPWMMFARKSAAPSGLDKPTDIVKAQGLVYGGQQPALILDMHGRLALDMLKVNYKYVHGYQGAAAIRLAMERDEVHVTTHGLQGYRSGVEQTLVKNGVAIPLWYFQRRDADGRYVPSPLVNDMPAFLDVYRQLRGDPRGGIEWEALELLTDFYGSASNFVWGPEGMDPAAIEPLRKAFALTMADPEFIAEQNQVFGFPHENLPLAEASKIIARLGHVSPALVEFFNKLMK